jgi:type IV conjugative transfer system coupling protein TraD
MSIGRNQKRHQFTRGAEVMRHEFGLYFAALLFSFMIACFAALGTSVFVINAALSDDEGEILVDRTLAHFNVMTGAPSEKVAMKFRRGGVRKVYEVPSDRLLEVTARDWVNIKVKLWIALWISIAAGISLFLITNRSWRHFGKQVGKDEVVRGTVFADPRDVTKELLNSGKNSPIRIAGVPLEREKEVLNVAVSGAIGTGKSIAIADVLNDIRASGGRAIVFDPTGEYIERFYRAEKDVILNPFDVRSPSWRVWNEARKPYDYANIAESFIPVTNRRETVWEEGAQAVLEDIMSRLAMKNQATNTRLIEVINVLTIAEIQEVVRALPGAVYMDPGAIKTALGIRMNVVRAAKAMRYLADGSPEDQFSIRDWVAADDSDGWLFLSTKEEMLSTMRPLITAWLDTALRAIMSLPPDRGRLLWQVVDELASLDKLSMLKAAITRSRKYGLASILGYQNIAQLREIYGDNDAQTIISMCQSQLTLRVPDYVTAEYISKNLGAQEIYEKDENISYGRDSTRDGVTIATGRETKDLVIPAEIQGLPDMTGYVRLAGRNEVMRVTFSYRDLPKIAAPFIEKEVTSYALDE